MIAVGIKEIKNQLSRYLALVKEGEEILVTRRGKPVARIVRGWETATRLHDALRPLVEKGLVQLPTRALDRGIRKPLRLSGKPASEMVLESRR